MVRRRRGGSRQSELKSEAKAPWERASADDRERPREQGGAHATGDGDVAGRRVSAAHAEEQSREAAAAADFRSFPALHFFLRTNHQRGRAHKRRTNSGRG